jgi:hypothetical protein
MRERVKDVKNANILAARSQNDTRYRKPGNRQRGPSFIDINISAESISFCSILLTPIEEFEGVRSILFRPARRGCGVELGLAHIMKQRWGLDWNYVYG